MDLFRRIEDGAAILRAKGGKYAQVDVYHRGADVFVKCAGGYVRVFNTRGDTSVPALTVLELEAPGVVATDSGKWAYIG